MMKTDRERGRGRGKEGKGREKVTEEDKKRKGGRRRSSRKSIAPYSGQCSLTLGGMPSLSPLGRVSILLSSSTLFRFSTHSGSTSPSKMIHCRLLISPRTLSMILAAQTYNTKCYNHSVHKKVHTGSNFLYKVCATQNVVTNTRSRLQMCVCV